MYKQTSNHELLQVPIFQGFSDESIGWAEWKQRDLVNLDGDVSWKLESGSRGLIMNGKESKLCSIKCQHETSTGWTCWAFKYSMLMMVYESGIYLYAMPINIVLGIFAPANRCVASRLKKIVFSENQVEPA